MSTTAVANDRLDTVGDLIDRLGGIDPKRILWEPRPGTATERDLIDIVDGDHKRLCELVDGTLVEKAMGSEQSFLAATLIFFLSGFVRPRRFGKVGGADAMMRMLGGNVRLPDVSFVSRGRWLALRDRRAAITDLAPDHAVEVLSKKNTRREMARKRTEYFARGTRLVWEVDLRRRTVTVYTSATDGETLSETDSLDGGDVLPGFRLPLVDLFNDPSDADE
jgi:Uma2 family endonuclease